MAELSQIIERLESVDVMEMTAESVVVTKEDYLSINLSQLAQGITSIKEPTLLDGLFYQPATIRHKQQFGVGLGAVTDRVTLYDTGKMYESAELQVVGEDIKVIFNTDYADDLLQRTGPDVIGLDDDNRSDYVNGVFFQAFKQLFENKTKLTLE